MSSAVVAQTIRQLPLFTALPVDEIYLLAESLNYREFQSGDILFNEGEIGDRLSIILDGKLEVAQAVGTPDERLLAVLGPGDFLGEMSLVFPNRKRSATARALTHLRVLELTQTDFEALLYRQPGLAVRVMQEMSNRLRNSEQATIRELQEKNQQLVKAYQELKSAQAKLIEKEKIEQELEVARSIQRGILPKEILSPEGWQFTPYWQPAHSVGGDFYDLFSFPDNQVGLIIGDVTGKGVPAALVMATTCSVLRALASSLNGEPISPGDFLARANDLLCSQMPTGMFVTCLMAVLDPVSGLLRFANAGHCLPYLCRRLDVIELRATGLPLGLIPGMNYNEVECAIGMSDVLMLYSDGLVEAHDPQRNMFGFPRLREILLQRPPDKELIPFMIDQLNEFTGPNWEQEDDITFFTIQRLPMKSQ